MLLLLLLLLGRSLLGGLLLGRCGLGRLALGLLATLALELALHGFVLQALLLDLLEEHHLGLGVRLQLDRAFAELLGLGQLVVERLALVLDVVDGGGELVLVAEAGTHRGGVQHVAAGLVGVGARVAEQRHQLDAAADEAPHGDRGQGRAQLVRVGLERGEAFLGLGDLDLELVELRLRVEHGLGGRVGTVLGVDDLRCGLPGALLARLGAGGATDEQRTADECRRHGDRHPRPHPLPTHRTSITV